MSILLHTVHMNYKVTYPLHTAGEPLVEQRRKTSHKDRAVRRPV